MVSRKRHTKKRRQRPRSSQATSTCAAPCEKPICPHNTALWLSMDHTQSDVGRQHVAFIMCSLITFQCHHCPQRSIEHYKGGSNDHSHYEQHWTVISVVTLLIRLHHGDNDQKRAHNEGLRSAAFMEAFRSTEAAIKHGSLVIDNMEATFKVSVGEDWSGRVQEHLGCNQ